MQLAYLYVSILGRGVSAEHVGFWGKRNRSAQGNCPVRHVVLSRVALLGGNVPVVLNMKLSRWGLLIQAKQSRLGCFGKSRGLGEIRHQDFAELLLLE